MASIVTLPSSWCNRAGLPRSKHFSVWGIMRLLSSLSILCLLASAWFVRAQNAPPESPSSGDPTFSVGTRLVVLHASVLDKNGKLVTNLAESISRCLKTASSKPSRLFRREDVPVSMGIIIDNSGSMRDKRHKVAAASLDLVNASNPQDEVFIVNFNDDAYLDQPFTNDIKKLEQALEHDRLQGRHRHARRHQHVDRLPEGQGQEG